MILMELFLFHQFGLHLVVYAKFGGGPPVRSAEEMIRVALLI